MAKNQFPAVCQVKWIIKIYHPQKTELLLKNFLLSLVHELFLMRMTINSASFIKIRIILDFIQGEFNFLKSW
ncbi:MAG: hypothetical protein EAZ42_01270 [Verrucomicrobia bacterium]|nr:MAG: hypothetical protein EAZ42_01270 [Verrucomicrobiota bacterium]